LKDRYLILIAVINFIIQTTILQNFRLFGVLPNTALLMIIIVTIIVGRWEGIKISFYLGILQDIFVSQALGLNLIIYLFTALIIGSIDEKIFKDNFISPMIMIVSMTIFYNVFYMIMMYFVEASFTIEYVLRAILIPEIFYNVLVGMYFYSLVFRKINGYGLR